MKEIERLKAEEHARALKEAEEAGERCPPLPAELVWTSPRWRRWDQGIIPVVDVHGRTARAVWDRFAEIGPEGVIRGLNQRALWVFWLRDSRVVLQVVVFPTRLERASEGKIYTDAAFFTPKQLPVAPFSLTVSSIYEQPSNCWIPGSPIDPNAVRERQ